MLTIVPAVTVTVGSLLAADSLDGIVVLILALSSALPRGAAMATSAHGSGDTAVVVLLLGFLGGAERLNQGLEVGKAEAAPRKFSRRVIFG
jgi:hypothetical protein